jgi:hypothetical protein
MGGYLPFLDCTLSHETEKLASEPSELMTPAVINAPEQCSLRLHTYAKGKSIHFEPVVLAVGEKKRCPEWGSSPS